MTQTVLAICQAALYDIGITPPSSLTSTTDSAQLQLKNILYATARALRNEGKLPQQKRVHKFTVKAGRSRYPLPQDFYAMSGDTHVDRSENIKLEGPINDTRWNSRLYEFELTGTPYGMRITGFDFNSATSSGQFELNPTPDTTGAVISFEYLTSTLFLPRHWAASTVYTAGSTENVNANGFVYNCSTSGTSGSIPPYHYTDGDGLGIGRDNSVEWAFVPDWVASTFYNVGDYVNSNSKIYKYTVAGLSDAATGPSHTSSTATDGTATAEYKSTPSAWAGGTSYTIDTSYVSANSKFFRCVKSGISGTTSPNFTASIWGEKGATNAPRWTYTAAPYETINATTDICIFDDDIMIAGVKYRYQDSKGLPYEADPITGESLEFRRLISRATGRFTGSYVGSMVRKRGWPRYIVPTRNVEY